jgi:hypothetical protein
MTVALATEACIPGTRVSTPVLLLLALARHVQLSLCTHAVDTSAVAPPSCTRAFALKVCAEDTWSSIDGAAVVGCGTELSPAIVLLCAAGATTSLMRWCTVFSGIMWMTAVKGRHSVSQQGFACRRPPSRAERVQGGAQCSIRAPQEGGSL